MKQFKMIAITLLFTHLISFTPVYAEPIQDGDTAITETIQENTETTVIIQTAADLSVLSENCRLDKYSQNLTVSLEADLDLSGVSFSGIPIFCGTFSGNGHTISGLQLVHTGSTVGFFRYLTETAVVTDLNIAGTISPQGNTSQNGGIVGMNAGTIQNCSFSGTVSGTDYVGGIAGTNTATGKIKNSSAKGIVYGNHFIGGIAGSNNGIIQDCTNTAAINTELQQNEVDLSDITIDSLTGSESFATVTDIGGIAGINSGTIIHCENMANIGYPRIGYNIGGIAGCQTGYISDCSNSGIISGRKDVGGIVGQLEPAIAITYSTDTIQILKDQVNDLSVKVNTATNHVNNSISSVKTQLILIQGKIENATDALNSLIPDDGSENPFPSIGEISDVIDTLDDTVSSVESSLKSISDSLSYADSVLTQDLQNISDSVAVIQQTLNNSSEGLGGTVTDLSDADTEGDLTAKIQRCQNSGMITADLNGGGIAGTIAFESDLDPENDIEILGDNTLNFSGAYRAVITDCDNHKEISVKKQYAGGIVGYATIGLIKNCTNTANLFVPDASYVGGISGRSNGQIRNCSVKAKISAKNNAGGIAGQGKTVSDCMVLTDIQGIEKIGSILGFTEDTSTLFGNYYMSANRDIGAIDGISYDGKAQSLSTEDFLARNNLPEFFKNYTTTFHFQDGSTQVITLQTNQSLSNDMVPVLPDIDGCKGSWVGLNEIGLFDGDITCSYESRFQVIESEITRNSTLPVLLAEGSFLPGTKLTITNDTHFFVEGAIEGWHYSCPGAVQLRYLPPENYEVDKLQILIQNNDGSWKEIPSTISGRYLVFTVDSPNSLFCVVTAKSIPWGLYLGITAVVLTMTGVITAFIIKYRKRKKAHATTETSKT